MTQIKDEERKPEQQQAWHALDAAEVLRHLEVQAEGLTAAEAAQRLAHYGENELEEAPRPTFLKMLWDQLNNFVVILLIVASVISALLGDCVEAAAIMAIVVLNAILGVVQEQPRRRSAGRPEEDGRARSAGRCATGSAVASRRASWCRAISSSWKRATSSRPMCACWRPSTCESKRPR